MRIYIAEDTDLRGIENIKYFEEIIKNKIHLVADNTNLPVPRVADLVEFKGRLRRIKDVMWLTSDLQTVLLTV
jgi:predicted fused transcriptional regulator/phosphomethylpyrimidine kinase